MNKTIVLLPLLLLTAATPLRAQKALKPVATYLKAKNGAEALKQVEKLQSDSTLSALPRLYDMGREAQVLINDAENEKVYLKQAYDTAKFFSSTLGIYTYILRCEEEEQRLLALGEKMKYHRSGGEYLRRYYANIGAGGKYFYNKKNYAEAMKYLRYYLDVPQMEIWGSDKSVTQQPTYAVAALVYQKSAFAAGDWSEVARYKDLTLADTTVRRSATLEQLASAAVAIGDTTTYVAYLQEGVTAYPDNIYFFTHLADYYSTINNSEAVLALADTLLQNDSRVALLWEAKSMALVNLQRYDEAIVAADSAIAVDSLQTDAYLYAGLSYYHKAEAIQMPEQGRTKAYRTAKEQRSNFYRRALPYLERYRALCPDEKNVWAPLLYQIYFSLNMGQQFEEISKVMKGAL